MRGIFNLSRPRMGITRMSATVAAIVMLVASTTVAVSNDVRATPIKDAAARADFIARSEIQSAVANVSDLKNTIENRSDTPLSVDWERGGITCLGRHQIGPHESQESAKSQIIAAAPISSEVKYGVRRQYTGLADVFTQTSAAPSGSLEASFYRKGRDGGISQRFALTSGIDGKGTVSTLSLESPDRTIIAVPMALGALLRDDPQLAAAGWRVAGTVPASQVALSDGTFGDIAVQRLGASVVLITPNVGAPKLTVRISGTGWSPRPLVLAAYDPDRTGLVAFTVNVFIPAARGGGVR